MPDPQTVLARTEAHVRATLEGEGSGHDWWHIHEWDGGDAAQV
jgi:hypothetical protein